MIPAGRKWLCLVLSTVIFVSGAMQAAIATEHSASNETASGDHAAETRVFSVEAIESPCGSTLEKRIVITDCCEGCDSGADSDCSLCLYGPITEALAIARLPSVGVAVPSAFYFSVPVRPPTPPPIA